jgi:DNA (cytosine-5)-methyltransferase 1
MSSQAAHKPRMLDLYCGAGGAAVGYARAGFDVTGVDLVEQPDYPFAFWHGDALALDYEKLLSFDAIHASPPCQAYCSITSSARKRGLIYPDLYARTKSMLIAAGLPYIIENVPGSPSRNAIKLCGTMFGLGVFRHRLFESNVRLQLPAVHCSCYQNRIGAGFVTVAGDSSTKAEGFEGMGIDWRMSKKQLNEAIPPAYTEFLGRQLMSIDAQTSRLNPIAEDECLVLRETTRIWRDPRSLLMQTSLW